MSVDLLRRAAAQMRERATAAYGGGTDRWQPLHDGASWAGAEVVADQDGHPLLAIPGHSDQGAADVEHVASWHPAVALAVGDWLEMVANVVEFDLFPASPARKATAHQALAVARAYLGEEE